MPSRNVSDFVITGLLNVPSLPSRLVLDCDKELTQRMRLVSGDVEALSFARARTRWSNYRIYVQAIEDWMSHLDMPDLLGDAELTLMACRGARYHHDAMQYGDRAFCNLFLSEDKGLDLHFPYIDKRIALQRGSVAIFDTAQPHAVIARSSTGFCESDFTPEPDRTLLFLTWELPLEHSPLRQALGLEYGAATAALLRLTDERLSLNGQQVGVCPRTGKWLAGDEKTQ